jgi:hypothetical protein
MDDNKFTELELRMQIVPQQSRWPAPDYIHWQKLHAVADEARERVAQTWAAFEVIDNDPDLSPEGKARQKKKVATAAITELEQSKTLPRAREAVDRQLDKWREKTGLAVRPPTNIADAVVQSEIRAHIANLKAGKLDFLAKHSTDPVVASAILCSPSFLSGMTDEEISFVRTKVEEHVAPDIAEAREAMLKGIKEAEQGWRRAIDKIAEHAGLTRAPRVGWIDRSMSGAA